MKKGLGVTLLILFEAIWLVVLILTFIYPENIALAVFGVISIIFLMPFNHENGHLLTCLLTKTKVTSYRYAILSFEEDSPNVIFRPSIACSVSFAKGDYSRFIYASGPFFDLLFFLVISIVFLLGPMVLSRYLIWGASAIFILFDLIPLKRSDIRRLFSPL